MTAADPRGAASPPLVLSALRGAVTSGAAVATRPGQLRSRLREALDLDVPEVRADAHLVVAAAEENLATLLTRMAPLEETSIADVAEIVANARGWRDEAALRAATYWACALGLLDDDALDALPELVAAPDDTSRSLDGAGRRPEPPNRDAR